MHSIDKEVEGYYDTGMTAPDYVTLLWTDDKCVLSSSEGVQANRTLAGKISVDTLFFQSVRGAEVLEYITT
jgi:hypothetical protein